MSEARSTEYPQSTLSEPLHEYLRREAGILATDQLRHQSLSPVELRTTLLRRHMTYDLEVRRESALHALTLASLEPSTARDYFFTTINLLGSTLGQRAKKNQDPEIADYEWLIPIQGEESRMYHVALYSTLCRHLDTSIPQDHDPS